MQEIIEYLNNRDGATEGAEIRTYNVWIHDREVRVALTDRGEGTDSLRYSAEAWWTDTPESQRGINDNGRTQGNPDGTAQGALDNLHWWIFKPQN